MEAILVLKEFVTLILTHISFLKPPCKKSPLVKAIAKSLGTNVNLKNSVQKSPLKSKNTIYPERAMISFQILLGNKKCNQKSH